MIEANVLAAKINVMISEVRKNQLRKLSDATYKQLWVKPRKKHQPYDPLLQDENAVNIFLPTLLSIQTDSL